MINTFAAVLGLACEKWKFALKCLFPRTFTFRFISRGQMSSSATGTAAFKLKNLPRLNSKQSEPTNFLLKIF